VPEVPAFVGAYKTWGANPTPVQAKDMYTALKSGMVEGMDQDLVSFYLGKYHEIQKYFTAVNYMRSGLGVWINDKKWAGLTKDDQAALLKSAQETEAYVNQNTAQTLKDISQELQAAGVELIEPDPAPWMKLSEPMVRKFEGKMWEAGLYDKIKALK
jgi:TRAP-type C4-dicarboxylate transport system substrate-binding protein